MGLHSHMRGLQALSCEKFGADDHANTRPEITVKIDRGNEFIDASDVSIENLFPNSENPNYTITSIDIETLLSIRLGWNHVLQQINYTRTGMFHLWQERDRQNSSVNYARVDAAEKDRVWPTGWSGLQLIEGDVFDFQEPNIRGDARLEKINDELVIHIREVSGGEVRRIFKWLPYYFMNQ